MSTKPARTPKDLGVAGRALWRSLAGQIAADGLKFDVRELVLLTHACREADMLALIEAELAQAACLTVRGAQGQLVAHPLLGEARRSRAQVASLLKAIGLDPPDEMPGTGRGVRTTSTQARTAALTRHYGQGAG